MAAFQDKRKIDRPQMKHSDCTPTGQPRRLASHFFSFTINKTLLDKAIAPPYLAPSVAVKKGAWGCLCDDQSTVSSTAHFQVNDMEAGH